MKDRWRQLVSEAKTSVLATTGPHGLNVVPVSVVELVGDEIRLYDFFMCKTAENIRSDQEVVLAVWEGFSGVQIKGRVAYESSGSLYDEAHKEMKKRFPERTLHGILRLSPISVYDVSPGAGGELVWLLGSENQ